MIRDIPSWALNGLFWPEEREMQKMIIDCPTEPSTDASRKILETTTSANDALGAVIALVRKQRANLATGALERGQPKAQWQLYGGANAFDALLNDLHLCQKRRTLA